MNEEDRQIWEKFVDLGGRSAQRLGFARSLGQIYAVLYLNPHSMGLENLMKSLHISKGNASMGVRQLAEWGLIRRIWVKGDRRDYYEVNPNFSEVLGQFLSSLIRPRIESTGAQLNDMRLSLEKTAGKLSPEGEFMRQRIAKMETLQRRAAKILPVLEKILK
ncbi:MAG: hypothetical protein PHD76_04260 [Methylacidiphilales bacterium]|nr:hypothetical protein [Candidatus Methylacidiphilales bacterium]